MSKSKTPKEVSDEKRCSMDPAYVKEMYIQYADIFERLLKLGDSDEAAGLLSDALEKYMKFDSEVRESQRNEFDLLKETSSKFSEAKEAGIDEAVQHSRSASVSLEGHITPKDFTDIKRYEDESMRDTVHTLRELEARFKPIQNKTEAGLCKEIEEQDSENKKDDNNNKKDDNSEPAQSNLSDVMHNKTHSLFQEEVHILEIHLPESPKASRHSKDYNETEESLKEMLDNAEEVAKVIDEVLPEHKVQYSLLGLVEVQGSHILS